MRLILLAIASIFIMSGCSISNVNINTDFNMLALKYSENDSIGTEPKPVYAPKGYATGGVKPIY